MPKRRIPPPNRCSAWLLAVVLLGAADVLVAQAPAGLTVELVDQRIATLRASGTPSDNTTLTTYEQVRGFLNDAGSYAREAATYQESLTSAPQREAEIQRRLDAQEEAGNPETELEGRTTDELRARLAEANAAQRNFQSRRETLDRRLAGRDASAAAIPVFGVAWAIFWTGFLRIGAQSALFLAPAAGLLLILRWLS